VAGNVTGWLLRSIGEAAAAGDANRAAVEAATAVSFGEPLRQGLFDLTELALTAGDFDAAGRLLTQAAPGMESEGTMMWHQRERFALLSARLALAAGDVETAATGAAAVAGEAAARGSRRHELFARLLVARAALAAGDAVDLNGVESVLVELDGVAGLEVWWLTAELAVASRSDRLWRAAADPAGPRRSALALQRAGAFAARAGPYRDQVAAHVTRRLGAL
jgi:hypothetical protein